MSVALPEPRAEPLGAPFYDFVDVPNPAAGANKVWVEGTSPVVAVVAARAHFVADANPANRVVSLDYIGKGVTYVRNSAAQVYVANDAIDLEWHANYAYSDFASNAPTYIPLLDIPLPNGITVQFTVDSVQAGDALTALKLVVVRYAPGEALARPSRRR